jgi:hypothetical protein
MLLIFVDETSDSKFKEYFGLSVATINHSQYKKIKNGFQDVLRKGGWDETIEFKGSYLFSATNGDKSVPIEKRIEIASGILDLNTANKNARMSFHYVMRKKTENHKQEYLDTLPLVLNKALPKATKGTGKDIAAIYCDHRSDITSFEVQNVIAPILKKKGFTLLEKVAMPHSNFHTVGILYADIVGYLSARIDTISNDSELFESIPVDQFENNGKVKKLKSSVELIKKIKNLDRYEVRR